MRKTILATLLVCVASSTLSAVVVPFTTLKSGNTGAIYGETQYVVARSTTQWKSYFQLPVLSQGESPKDTYFFEPPAVDFEKQMVVGVLVPGSTGCTAGTIKQVEMEPHRILVIFETWRHRTDEICAAAFKLAFHFVAIPASDLKVEFLERKN